jgi:hypothetical protein
MRGSEAASQAMGVNLLKYRLIAFAFATAFAALSGVLYVHFVRYSYPSIWSLETIVGLSGNDHYRRFAIDLRNRVRRIHYLRRSGFILKTDPIFQSVVIHVQRDFNHLGHYVLPQRNRVFTLRH